MNFVADENVDGPIVYQLRHDGHDVIYIAKVEPAIDDDIILDHANKRNALLITTDKDFGELVFRQHLVHAGVILLRIEGFSPSRKPRMSAKPSVSIHVRS
jgi:predicted nuclease of predicted toxin-antitoxin system